MSSSRRIRTGRLFRLHYRDVRPSSERFTILKAQAGDRDSLGAVMRKNTLLILQGLEGIASDISRGVDLK